MLRLYARVLGLLGPQRKLGWVLALANVALAAARLRRAGAVRPHHRCLGERARLWRHAGLAEAHAARRRLGRLRRCSLILCGALVALYADRLAHKRRQVVLSDYFEHVLQLPLSFHSATHSGRLMKVMLAGTDTLWWLWLGFFREHLAAIVSVAVLLPLSLYLNWRLGAAAHRALRSSSSRSPPSCCARPRPCRESVERYYSDLAERASDTLGNVALVQSFTRVEDEVRELRAVVDRLLGAQMPVLSWWAVVSTITKASTTLTMLPS